MSIVKTKIPRVKRKPVAHEHTEQVALFQWAAVMGNRLPELKLMFATPNGGQRHIAVAAKLKAEGVRSGVPDIFLPAARCAYHGFFIELKRRDGGKTSETQDGWIDALRVQGYRVAVCHGAEAAISEITNYLLGGAL
jgi:hypothetical protein